MEVDHISKIHTHTHTHLIHFFCKPPPATRKYHPHAYAHNKPNHPLEILGFYSSHVKIMHFCCSIRRGENDLTDTSKNVAMKT